MPAQEGEVVLDVIHRVQASEAPDLACRWNCKAGKCGSCSAEINGRPSLMCMTRMDTLPPGETVTVAPMRAFPIIRDLVTDVSYNYEVAKRIPPLSPRDKTDGRGEGRRLPHGPDRRRAEPGVPQVHRVLPVPGRLPRGPRPRGEQDRLRRSPVLHPLGRARDAPAGHQRPPPAAPGGAGPRQVQHHQVLHRGVPRAHQDHRQRHHPAQGAGGRRQVRPGGMARAQDPEPDEAHRRGGGRRGTVPSDPPRSCRRAGSTVSRRPTPTGTPAAPAPVGAPPTAPAAPDDAPPEPASPTTPRL